MSLTLLRFILTFKQPWYCCNSFSSSYFTWSPFIKIKPCTWFKHSLIQQKTWLLKWWTPEQSCPLCSDGHCDTRHTLMEMLAFFFTWKAVPIIRYTHPLVPRNSNVNTDTIVSFYLLVQNVLYPSIFHQDGKQHLVGVFLRSLVLDKRIDEYNRG